MMWRLRCQMLLLHGHVKRTGCCKRAAGRNGAASIAPASQPDAIHAARRCMLLLCSGEGRQKTSSEHDEHWIKEQVTSCVIFYARLAASASQYSMPETKQLFFKENKPARILA
jgi:hypothetical protein